MNNNIGISETFEQIFNRIFDIRNCKDLSLKSINKESYLLMVLCTAENYMLKRRQYEALMCTARSLAEKNFFVSELEENNNTAKIKRVYDLYTSTSYDVFCTFKMNSTTFIISESGRWAVAISSRKFALFIGDRCSCQIFASFYSYKFDRDSFLKEWKNHKRAFNTDIEDIIEIHKKSLP